MADDKTYTGIYDFLEKEGYLTDDSTPEHIEEGKKQYRRWYKNFHKKQSRKNKPEITVIFTNKADYRKVQNQAKKHNRSLSAFLRDCVLSYINNGQYIQLHPDKYTSIEQYLKITEHHVQKIMAQTEDEEINSYTAYDQLLEQFIILKEEITQTLNKPELLKDAIQQYIQEQPWEKQKLLEHIQNL